MRSSCSDRRRLQFGVGGGSEGGSGGGGSSGCGGGGLELMRGDNQYANSIKNPENQPQHQQLPDKWTCPCGGSCSDELSRLESRLVLMESRLTDFEALIKSSGRSLSQSGDGGSRHNWPESMEESPPQPEPLLQLPQSSPTIVPMSNKAEFEATTGDLGGRETAAATTEPSHGGTALNLVFTEDESSSSSSTWTDLSSKEARTPLPKTWVAASESAAGGEQQNLLVQPLPIQPKEPLTCRTSRTDSSFDMVRYSAQEKLVHQERNDLVSCISGAMVGETPPQMMHANAQQLLCGLRHADDSLINTELGRAENLLAMPEDKQDTSWSVVEPVPRYEVVAPPASVKISRSCTEQRRILRGRAAEGDIPAFSAFAAAAIGVLSGADAVESCETATVECPSDLVVVRSRVTRVRGGSVAGVLGNARWGPQLQEAAASGTTSAAALACAQQDISDDDERATVSNRTGVETTASARGLTAGHHWKADNLPRSSSSDHDVRGGLCDGDDSTNASTCCNEDSNEKPDMSTDCRLCSDIVPYTRRRLRDLGRGSGVGGDGFCRRRARRDAGGKHGSSTMNVCIQRSGFSQLDTVLLAGLVLKAASLHDTEGDQASFIRLTLRKMGFECAVIIGRHFTGCICGLDSSRLLLDFGDRSCLIFSFFQLTASLNQLSSVK